MSYSQDRFTMKAFFLFAAILFIPALSFAQESRKDGWEYVSRTFNMGANHNVYYTPAKIQHSDAHITTVQARYEISNDSSATRAAQLASITEWAQKNTVALNKVDKYSYSLVSYEFDCVAQTFRIVSISWYDSDNQSIGTWNNTATTLKKISQVGFTNTLAKKICEGK